jgi:hypothetical protein
MAEINNVMRLIGLSAKLPAYSKQFLNILYGFWRIWHLLKIF